MTDSKVAAPQRPLHLGPFSTVARPGADGSLYLDSPEELGEFPVAVTERLWHWADRTPDAVFLAKRQADGDWSRLTYKETRRLVRSVSQALLDRRLSAERPIVILSENDLDHALLALAAMHVGIPYAPISPPYSLLSKDHEKLRHAIELLTPGLVFASDGGRYGAAIAAVVPQGTEVVISSASIDRASTAFVDLEGTAATDAVEQAHASVTGDTIAKFLFTSGSTKAPKAVINTHRMLCSNQQMFSQCFPFLTEEPPVLVDWLPWHHTFGGNFIFGLVLYHGGSLYIDDGKPTPDGAAETGRNLREICPTIYLTVPKGLDELVVGLRNDPILADRFFARLRLLYPAGAALSAATRSAFEELAVATCGYRIPMSMSLGMTETAPFAVSAHLPEWRAGVIGLPAPGVQVKLCPIGDKSEVRYRGPSITPGYWRQADLTLEAFDGDGFFCSGDAACLIDPADPQQGLRFDGRIAEDFKLVSGTWVNVGALRAKLIAAGAPYIQDVVVTGHDRNDIGTLIFLQQATSHALSPRLSIDSTLAQIALDDAVRSHISGVLASLNQESTGSSNRIMAAVLLEAPASMELGECTDKGSINQRNTLRVRAELVEAIYGTVEDSRVLRPSRAV